ncbi:secretogranin-1 [Apodemus sylvaticus]|uniref:secretogranin-1 n=1 Tax=Apodemus sylvaticus TaxID=10129 RepID=UPI002243062C|nr:secretogranin-1 [Apodemus sylvaticus]
MVQILGDGAERVDEVKVTKDKQQSSGGHQHRELHQQDNESQVFYSFKLASAGLEVCAEELERRRGNTSWTLVPPCLRSTAPGVPCPCLCLLGPYARPHALAELPPAGAASPRACSVTSGLSEGRPRPPLAPGRCTPPALHKSQACAHRATAALRSPHPPSSSYTQLGSGTMQRAMLLCLLGAAALAGEWDFSTPDSSQGWRRWVSPFSSLDPLTCLAFELEDARAVQLFPAFPAGAVQPWEAKRLSVFSAEIKTFFIFSFKAVSSAPVENRDHNEEMVTRCIIEVLSNALSKSSVPTITPECRQVLRKSGKEVKGEEKGENENSKFQVRLLRDPSDASAARWASSREETGAPVEDSQGQRKVDYEKRTEGGGHSRERADDQESLHSPNQQESKEAKIRHSEERGGKEMEEEEEEGKIYPKGAHREDAGEEKKRIEDSGEKSNTLSNKRSEASAKKEESAARADAHSWGLEEKTHSREQSSQESGEEARGQEKPQELTDLDQSLEESEEGEEGAASEVTKRRPRHHHGRSRPNKPSYEGHPLSEERRHAPEESEEADVATAGLGGKGGHHLAHYRASEEEPEYGEELRSYPGFQAPQGLRGPQYRGRGSEEDGAPGPGSEESQDREDKTNHPEPESTANRHGEESEKERSYEGAKGRQHRGRGREPAAYATLDTREEKRLLDEGRYPVHESQIDAAKRFPQSRWQEQEKNYLNYGEEGDPGRWWQQEEQVDPQESREEVGFPDTQYEPYPTAEKRKRLGALFNPYFDPLQWKTSDFEKKGNPDDNFLEDEGEDGNGVTLTEKNFFPEYNYDWWEKRPFSEDVNWGYEKGSFARAPHRGLKRQYSDGVAELDQLLHYRKKAAEFPDFYDSEEEQMGPHQEAENEKDRADRRVLTEEEKKELENLAAMDLELQKIAEKFSQRG